MVVGGNMGRTARTAGGFFPASINHGGTTEAAAGGRRSAPPPQEDGAEVETSNERGARILALVVRGWRFVAAAALAYLVVRQLIMLRTLGRLPSTQEAGTRNMRLEDSLEYRSAEMIEARGWAERTYLPFLVLAVLEVTASAMDAVLQRRRDAEAAEETAEETGRGWRLTLPGPGTLRFLWAALVTTLFLSPYVYFQSVRDKAGTMLGRTAEALNGFMHRNLSTPLVFRVQQDPRVQSPGDNLSDMIAGHVTGLVREILVRDGSGDADGAAASRPATADQLEATARDAGSVAFTGDYLLHILSATGVSHAKHTQTVRSVLDATVANDLGEMLASDPDRRSLDFIAFMRYQEAPPSTNRHEQFLAAGMSKDLAGKTLARQTELMREYRQLSVSIQQNSGMGALSMIRPFLLFHSVVCIAALGGATYLILRDVRRRRAEATAEEEEGSGEPEPEPES